MNDYVPLYGERKIGRCVNCGYWRGQHIGSSGNDNDMLCPPRRTFVRPAPDDLWESA